MGNLTLVGSTLYGMAEQGGAGLGTIFSVPVAGGPATTLLDFYGPNGEDPTGGLTRIGSILYGAAAGGANSVGILFSISLTGSDFTTLHTFNGTDGDLPKGDLTLIGTTLYGTTQYGGANHDGTVFARCELVPEPSSVVLLGFGPAPGSDCPAAAWAGGLHRGQPLPPAGLPPAI